MPSKYWCIVHFRGKFGALKLILFWKISAQDRLRIKIARHTHSYWSSETCAARLTRPSQGRGRSSFWTPLPWKDQARRAFQTGPSCLVLSEGKGLVTYLGEGGARVKWLMIFGVLRGVACLVAYSLGGGVCSQVAHDLSSSALWTESQTRVKTLPSLVLRTWAVKIAWSVGN